MCSSIIREIAELRSDLRLTQYEFGQEILHLQSYDIDIENNEVENLVNSSIELHTVDEDEKKELAVDLTVSTTTITNTVNEVKGLCLEKNNELIDDLVKEAIEAKESFFEKNNKLAEDLVVTETISEVKRSYFSSPLHRSQFL